MQIHRVDAPDHAVAAAALAGAGPDDLAVVVPVGAGLIATDDAAVAETISLFDGGIAVGAATAPCGAPDEDAAFIAALVEQVGDLPYRAHPHPLAFGGPAPAVRALLEDLAGADGSPVGAIVDAFANGTHDLVLDLGGQVVRVLDGTGTDVVAVDGALAAGPERPAAVVGLPETIDALQHAWTIPSAARLARLVDHGGLSVAAHARDLAREPAPEILTMPCWTPEACADLIALVEAANMWSPDPDDPVPGLEVSLRAVAPDLVERLQADLAATVWPRLVAHWPEVAVTPIHDAFVIRYEPGPVTDHLPLHHDIAQVSASIRLNRGYEGGELVFPRQRWDNCDLDVGDLVAWPSLVTHPHGGAPVTAGAKYGLTIWFALPA